MDNIRLFEDNQAVWNRRLLNGFWCVLLLSVIVECIYIGEASSIRHFVCMHIIRPSVLLVAVISMAEAGLRFLPRQHDYILISSSALISIIVAIMNADQTYVLFSLFVPVLVGFFYYQLQKLLFAVAVSFLSFGIICYFASRCSDNLNAAKISGIVCLMALMCLLMVGTMVRGTELVEILRAPRAPRRELLVESNASPKSSVKDSLTGVYNHTSFHEYLDLLIKQSESGMGSLQLAFVNLDGFRQWNACYGHRAGDEALQQIARVMMDKIGYRHLLARYGGEEFALLFAGTTTEDATAKLEEIREAIAAVPHGSFNNGHVTVSAGLSVYIAGLGKEAFLKRVQAALSKAKASGRNRTVVI